MIVMGRPSRKRRVGAPAASAQRSECRPGRRAGPAEPAAIPQQPNRRRGRTSDCRGIGGGDIDEPRDARQRCRSHRWGRLRRRHSVASRARIVAPVAQSTVPAGVTGAPRVDRLAGRSRLVSAAARSSADSGVKIAAVEGVRYRPRVGRRRGGRQDEIIVGHQLTTAVWRR